MKFHSDELGMDLSFPHTMTLCAERKLLWSYLRHSPKEATKPVVGLWSHRTGRVVFAIHPLEAGNEQTAEQFFESVVSGGLGGAEVVEPVQYLEIGGRTFQMVGFVHHLGATTERHRLYQFYHPESRRVMLISTTADIKYWDQEVVRLHQVVSSLKLDW